MRLPLVVPIMSRDGTLTKGSKLVNVYTEGAGGRPMVFSRPGISTAVNSLVGYGNGVYNNGDIAYSIVDNNFQQIAAGKAVCSFTTTETASTFTKPIVWYFKNKYWMVDGDTNSTDVYSRDHLSTGAWTLTSSALGLAGSPGAPCYAVQVFNGKVYHTCGSTNIFIRFSDDGYTWSTYTVSQAIAQSTPSTGSRWDSIYEADGTLYFHMGNGTNSTFTVSTKSPEFVSSWGTFFVINSGGKKTDGQSWAYLNGFHYMVAGRTSSLVYSQSVHRGTNGISYGYTATTNFVGRSSFALVAHNDLLWMLGGHVSSGVKDGRMYTSPDGLLWIDSSSCTTLPLTYLGGYAVAGEAEGIIASYGVSSTTINPIVQIYDTPAFVNASWNISTVSTFTNPNNVPMDFVSGEPT